MNKTTLTRSFAKGLVLFFVIALALALNLGQPPFVARADEGTVTPHEARRAALAWLNICPSFTSISYTPAPEMLEIKGLERKQTIAYVLELQPKGFIIVTPSFELNPIIAYSEDSVFDATETPENILLDLLRGDIRERLQALGNGVISSSYRDEARSRWESYLREVDAQGRVRTEGAPLRRLQSYDVEHGPFLSSTWGQGDAGGEAIYNYYTPPGPDGDSDNYVCGCVATALGQILNYYEWPVTGTGSHSYQWYNGVDWETLSADFGATTYDWANVMDGYSGLTEAQRQAAGTVTYHAGVAVDMNYGSGGSSAYTADVAGALKNYFRASGEYVKNTGQSFYDRLYANMVSHRPAELSISRTGGGHAVVVDGLRHNTDDDDNKTRYYHLNMGWWGTDDTWYDLPDVTTPSGNPDYDTVNGAVLDIVPTPNLDDPGTTTTDSAFTVSWNVADLQDATKYELQQALIGDTLGNFADGAEDGTGDWMIDGNWKQTSLYKRSGSYSFKGYVSEVTDGELPFSSFTLDKAVQITDSTTINYWWGTRYFHWAEARLEISTDEKNWTALKTHTEANMGGIVWHSETVTTGELAAYVGEVVSLRFVIDAGSSWYVGSVTGFYLDDFAINNCYSGDWATVDNNITTESKLVTVTEDGDYGYRVRANCSQWWDWSDMETVTVSGLHNSVATGDWHTDGTWDTGSAPSASNSAILNADHTVTVDSNAQCHDLVIMSDGTLVVPTGVTLSIASDWVKDGTFTPNGTVTFNGTSVQTISGNNTFYDLSISNTADIVTFNDDVTVSNDLTIGSGATMDMGTNKITSIGGTFTNNGTLCNNESHSVTSGSGPQTFQDAQGSDTAQITYDSGDEPGSTTITCECGSTIANNAFGAGCSAVSNSVERYYNVSAADNDGLNVTLRLYYDDAELNGNTEGSLEIYHCESGSWVKETGAYSRDGTNNYVEVTGVDSFSPFVLSGAPPTVVTLQRFTASPARGGNGFVLPLALVALGAVGLLVLRARRR